MEGDVRYEHCEGLVLRHGMQWSFLAIIADTLAPIARMAGQVPNVCLVVACYHTALQSGVTHTLGVACHVARKFLSAIRMCLRSSLWRSRRYGACSMRAPAPLLLWACAEKVPTLRRGLGTLGLYGWSLSHRLGVRSQPFGQVACAPAYSLPLAVVLRSNSRVRALNRNRFGLACCGFRVIHSNRTSWGSLLAARSVMHSLFLGSLGALLVALSLGPPHVQMHSTQLLCAKL